VLLIALGLLSVVVVVDRILRMDRHDGDVVAVSHYLRVLPYLPWLLKEVFLANIQVARLLLSPRVRIDPVFTLLTASQKTDWGRFVHANPITLTPGTVTVRADGSNFEIHVLTAHMAPPGTGGDMDARVCRIETGVSEAGDASGGSS